MTEKPLFGDWLQSILDERGMSQADLARRMGKKTGVVSNLINNKRQQPAVESCKLIADALNLPLEEVYRAADILPETPEADPITEAIIALTKNLDPQERQEILDYVRYKNERVGRNKNLLDPGDSKRTVGVTS